MFTVLSWTPRFSVKSMRRHQHHTEGNAFNIHCCLILSTNIQWFCSTSVVWNYVKCRTPGLRPSHLTGKNGMLSAKRGWIGASIRGWKSWSTAEAGRNNGLLRQAAILAINAQWCVAWPSVFWATNGHMTDESQRRRHGVVMWRETTTDPSTWQLNW